jgi:2-polyprenyl-3-methyl-5-hydroxy-6-metoxy-1,4-benzoquinol methylase
VKYDANVDPAESNTSHVQVLDLVGTDKRVLDVGCSTGYLAQLLRDRNNQVSGVEIDPEAAELARPYLERVVIGDLETMDLVDEFGEERFDVVVFADVLEHLRDPLKLLTQAQRLLAEGGSVVVSLPNIAHGSVRLALLEGRFEYRPLGLLDDTHLRFFTRSTAIELLRASGLAPVDIRRTTAGVFETEIPVDRAHFSEPVVKSIIADPESATYQFIIRAVPTDVGQAGAHSLVSELVAKDQELQELRGQMAKLVQAVGDPRRAPVVGVCGWHGPDDSNVLGILQASVVESELRRRLNRFAIRLYGNTSDGGHDWKGEPVHPLLPLDQRRREAILNELDALVLIIDTSRPMDPDDKTLAEGIEDLRGRGLPVFVLVAPVGRSPVDRAWTTFASGQSRPRRIVSAPIDSADPPVRGVDILPDPLALGGRLIDPSFLSRRAEYLRLLEVLPRTGTMTVIDLSERQRSALSGLGRALSELCSKDGSTPVLLSTGKDGEAPFAAELKGLLSSAPAPQVLGNPLDVLATIFAADLVITDSAPLLCLALALARPTLAFDATGQEGLESVARWYTDPDLLIHRPGLMAAAVEQATDRSRRRTPGDVVTSALDLSLDDLADAVVGASGRRAVLSIPARLAELISEIDTLRVANAGIRQSTARERMAFGQRTREVSISQPVSRAVPTQTETHRLEVEIDEVRAELANTRAQLEATLNTRTMRTVAPARRVYARLLHIRRSLH